MGAISHMPLALHRCDPIPGQLYSLAGPPEFTHLLLEAHKIRGFQQPFILRLLFSLALQPSLALKKVESSRLRLTLYNPFLLAIMLLFIVIKIWPHRSFIH